MYSKLEELIIKSSNVETGNANVVQQEWIKSEEQLLGFALPKSYAWALQRFEFIKIKNQALKEIAPPEYREDADSDILYSYKVNIENNILNPKQIALLELEDELYYFQINEEIKDYEYPIYLRDYYNNEENLYANNFSEFIENKINES